MRRLMTRAAGALLAASLFFAPASQCLAEEAKAKANPTDADMDKARKHMATAGAFMEDPDGEHPEEAYPEFRKAYELSGSLNALYSLAVCAHKLELDGEAIAYYTTVLEKDKDLGEDKAQVEKDLATLKSSVAWVTLSSDKPGVTITDTRTPRSGSSIRNTYQIGIQSTKIGLHPGNHVIVAKTGELTVEWSKKLSNGGSFTHEFVFDKNAPLTAEGIDTPVKPPPDEQSDDGGGIPTSVWIVGGITVASAITWGVFMGVAAGQKADYDDNILGKKPLAEQQTASDDLATTNLIADIMLGVTVAGAATTTILLVTADGDAEEAASDGPKFGKDYTIAPIASLHSVGAMFTSSF